MERSDLDTIELDSFDDINTLKTEQVNLKLPLVVSGENKPTERKYRFYQKKYCQMLHDHMANGYSFCSFACVIGITVKTLMDWEKEHPDFADARAMGQTYSYYFWQKLGMAGVQGKIKGFNANAWIFTMKNRFDWRENKEIIRANEEGATVYHVETTKEGRFISARPKVV
jgi:hypothetical protein